MATSIRLTAGVIVPRLLASNSGPSKGRFLRVSWNEKSNVSWVKGKAKAFFSKQPIDAGTNEEYFLTALKLATDCWEKCVLHEIESEVVDEMMTVFGSMFGMIKKRALKAIEDGDTTELDEMVLKELKKAAEQDPTPGWVSKITDGELDHDLEKLLWRALRVFRRLLEMEADNEGLASSSLHSYSTSPLSGPIWKKILEDLQNYGRRIEENDHGARLYFEHLLNNLNGIK